MFSMDNRHESTRHLLRLLSDNEHLPVPLRNISQYSAELAFTMAARLQDGPELFAGLRKILEAKDCFVRQAVIDDI